MNTREWCAALVVFVVGLPTVARADSAEAEAQAIYAEGARYFDLGDYDHAVERFERAYTLSGAPGLLLDIAQAYRLEGPAACDKARAFYERFLHKSPSSARRSEVESRIVEMKACAAREPSSSRPPAATGSTATAQAPSPEPPRAAPDRPPAPSAADPPAGHGWKTLAFGSVAVAVAGAGVAGITGALALNRQSILENACSSDGGCPPSERSHLQQYQTFRTTALVGGIVGGAALALAAFSFWRASLAPAPVAGGAGVRLGGTF